MPKISEVEYVFNSNESGKSIIIHRGNKYRTYRYTLNRDAKLSKYAKVSLFVARQHTLDFTYAAIDIMS